MTEDRRQHSSFNEVDRRLFSQMAANIAAACGKRENWRTHKKVNACNHVFVS
jgi:hypothetical protein